MTDKQLEALADSLTDHQLDVLANAIDKRTAAISDQVWDQLKAKFANIPNAYAPVYRTASRSELNDPRRRHEKDDRPKQPE